MVKEINENWANEILKGNHEMGSNEETKNKPIEFVRSNNGFKRSIKFKVVATNSKENKIFCHIVGTHWLTDENGNSVRFVCPEKTQHLKHENVVCPICEAKRKLIKEGFKEEELCVQGKYGPIPVFDPRITSNLKVIVVESDAGIKWDKEHISILQQNGEFLTKWLVRQYQDPDNPNFLDWEHSHLFSFTRQSDNGRWERSFSHIAFTLSPEVIERLKKENEELTMFDLWKMPVDEDFLKVTEITNKLCENYRDAKNALRTGVNIVENAIDDDIPF